jgi:hypothetical protein
MKLNILTLINNNKKNIIISIFFIMFFILFLIRQRMINKGIKRLIGKFTNIEDCSTLDLSVCSKSTICTEWDTENYKCCLPNSVQPIDHNNICNRSANDIWMGGTGGGPGDGSGTGPPSGYSNSTTTQQQETTTRQQQETTTTQQQETTTTKPVSSNNNDNNDNNSNEEDVLIEEESFLPLIFNGENNIYTSQYYGFGNLFSPHTEIYNY